MSDSEQLRREIAALRHELRRVKDGLERSRNRDLEQRSRQLRQSIALCETQLKSNSGELQSAPDQD